MGNQYTGMIHRHYCHYRSDELDSFGVFLGSNELG